MQTTMDQLVTDLYEIHRSGKAGYSTSVRAERDKILEHLDTIPSWEGSTQMVLSVTGVRNAVLVLTRTVHGLLYRFDTVLDPRFILHSVTEWRDGNVLRPTLEIQTEDETEFDDLAVAGAWAKNRAAS